MNPTLYSYYSTISEKISTIFIQYMSCLEGKILSYDINKQEELKFVIEKFLDRTQSPNKDKLKQQMRTHFSKNNKFDFYLSLKLLIELYQYTVYKDVFSRSFIRCIMKETLLLRNMFFHSNEYTDEHIFRFFENCFHFFKMFHFPNDSWIKFKFPNYKEDEFIKYDMPFAMEVLVKILSQKGFKIHDESSISFINKEESFFMKPLNPLHLKQMKEMSNTVKLIEIEKDENIKSYKVPFFEFDPVKKDDNDFIIKRNANAMDNVVVSNKVFDDFEDNSNIISKKNLKSGKKGKKGNRSENTSSIIVNTKKNKDKQESIINNKDKDLDHNSINNNKEILENKEIIDDKGNKDKEDLLNKDNNDAKEDNKDNNKDNNKENNKEDSKDYIDNDNNESSSSDIVVEKKEREILEDEISSDSNENTNKDLSNENNNEDDDSHEDNNEEEDDSICKFKLNNISSLNESNIFGNMNEESVLYRK